MRKLLLIIMALILLPIETCRAEKIENVAIHYNRGADRELCQEIYKLFALPENENYLYNPSQPNKISEEQKLNEWHTNRELFVPKTKEFKNTIVPDWKDVSDSETLLKHPDFLSSIKERLKEYETDIVLGRDYKIQEAQIDMNIDGVPETVYRSVSIDSGSLKIKGSATNFISIHSKMNGVLIFPGLHLKGQIIIFKNMPVFLTRELGLTALEASPSLENGNIHDNTQPFEPLGCTFSYSDKYMGD